jgi:uncharacterized Zn-binding protein involved in type VI secretion
MSRGVARLNDQTRGVCAVHGPQGGKITTASTDVITNNRGTARLNDEVTADCGHKGKISTASTTYETNGRGTARLDDQVNGTYTANIITASTDTIADNS